MKYKVHIDGYNLLPYLTGEVDKSPRRGMIYFSDDGDVLGIRAENWKVVFMEQRCPGTLQVWFEPFTPLRAPKLFNLRTDPYRARRHHVEHLLGLVDRPRLPRALRLCDRDPVPGDVQGVPTAPGTGIVHDQPRGRGAQQVPRHPGRLSVAELAILDGRTHEVGDRRLRGSRHRRGRAGLRCARGACRGVRQRRHAVVREAGVHPARLHRAPAGREGRRRPVVGASSSRTRRRSSGDLQWFGGADHQALPGRRLGPESACGSGAVAARVDDASRTTRPRSTRSSPKPRTRRWAGRTGSARTRRWWSCCAIWRPTASPATSCPAAAAISCGPITGAIYGIPPERVVGSAQGLRFDGTGRTRRPADPAGAGHLRRRAR